MTPPYESEVSAKPARPLSISVAMATYQGARYIRLQLDSITKQSLLPQELVITDDGSADGTLDIVQDFASAAPFAVRAARNDVRLKYADNFLRAASLCTGDVIAFCDQDDLWQPQKLITCVEQFSDPSVLLVLHAAQTFTDAQTLGHHFPPVPSKRVWLSGESDPLANKPGFAMVGRRELVELAMKVKRPGSLYSHDHWIWFLAASAGSIATLPDVLTLYRQHETNVYGAGEKKTLAFLLKTGVEIPRYSDVANAEEACADALREAMLKSPPQWAAALQASIERLALRAKFHRLRSDLYSPASGLFNRIGIFARLLIGGAYMPDSSHTRMGPQAGAKDTVLGLLGIFRKQPAGETAKQS